MTILNDTSKWTDEEWRYLSVRLAQEAPSIFRSSNLERVPELYKFIFQIAKAQESVLRNAPRWIQMELAMKYNLDWPREKVDSYD